MELPQNFEEKLRIRSGLEKKSWRKGKVEAQSISVTNAPLSADLRRRPELEKMFLKSARNNDMLLKGE